MSTSTDSDLVGSTEACSILADIDRSTLSRWVKDGRIKPKIRLPGSSGAMLFDRAEVEALAESLTEQPNSKRRRFIQRTA